LKSQRHLQHIRNQPCALCASNPEECSGSVQAHHLMKPWLGYRGTGMKAGDENAIPLCFEHHRDLHAVGNEANFFKLKGLSENYGKALAYGLWLRSPYFKEKEK
tara:strand:+ start:824 stop:1135 length:312 start_codon:yes stop_codon:yes gene_type:complete